MVANYKTHVRILTFLFLHQLRESWHVVLYTLTVAIVSGRELIPQMLNVSVGEMKRNRKVSLKLCIPGP